MFVPPTDPQPRRCPTDGICPVGYDGRAVPADARRREACLRDGVYLGTRLVHRIVRPCGLDILHISRVSGAAGGDNACGTSVLRVIVSATGLY